MSNPIQLILHVGHGKTGSSALQSAFAISACRLREAGIEYPPAKSDIRARRGRISSGNLPLTELEDRYWQASRQSDRSDSILFSNENLFRELLRDGSGLNRLLAADVPVRLLLFIRDPLGHAVSAYGQSVKRGGSTKDFDGYFLNYLIPHMVNEFLKHAEDAGLDVTVRNYTRHAHRLLDCMADMLGLSPGDLEGPETQIVNRSLTPSELSLQRSFNAHWGQRSSAFVSDALCNRLPRLQSDARVDLRRDTYDRVAARLLPVIEEVNARIPLGESYSLEPYESVTSAETADDELLTFSPEQIRVFAKSVSARMPSELQVEEFLNVVQGLRARRKVGTEEINALREFAHIFRPAIKPLK